MKNKLVSQGSVPSSQPMEGRVLYDYMIGQLEGKLLTLIETLGLKDSQEKSAKDMLREIVRTALYLDSFYVRGSILQEALDKEFALRENEKGNGMPTFTGK